MDHCIQSVYLKGSYLYGKILPVPSSLRCVLMCSLNLLLSLSRLPLQNYIMVLEYNWS